MFGQDYAFSRTFTPGGRLSKVIYPSGRLVDFDPGNPQPGQGKTHGDTVVIVSLDISTVRSSAGHQQSIIFGDGLDTHFVKLGACGGQPVALLGQLRFARLDPRQLLVHPGAGDTGAGDAGDAGDAMMDTGAPVALYGAPPDGSRATARAKSVSTSFTVIVWSFANV